MLKKNIHNIVSFCLYSVSMKAYVTIHRHGSSTIRHANGTKFIPFEIVIKLPPLLQTGIDHGFKPAQPLNKVEK